MVTGSITAVLPDKVRLGVSASGSTETVNVPVCVAVLAPSVDVTVTDRSKSWSSLLAGVIVKFDNCAGVKVASPSVMEISVAPDINTAPSGMPPIVMLKVSPESALLVCICRAIA